MSDKQYGRFCPGRRRFVAQSMGAFSLLSLGMSFNGVKAFEADTLQGQLFNPRQMALLATVVDLVIPATDTPGALLVNCHGFIDHQLLHCHSKDEQQSMLALLALIEKSSQQRGQRNFIDLPQASQIQLLVDIELAQSEFKLEHRQQFKQLKRLICFGYYTSKVGASQELAYQAIPGGYQGSVPYAKLGKAWGSIAYY